MSQVCMGLLLVTVNCHRFLHNRHKNKQYVDKVYLGGGEPPQGCFFLLWLFRHFCIRLLRGSFGAAHLRDCWNVSKYKIGAQL